MSKLLLASLATLLAAIPVTSQSQEFMEPKMEIHDFYGMEAVQFIEGIHGADVPLKTIKFARIEIEKGKSTPHHNHPDEQFVLVIRGKIKAKSKDAEYILGPGELIAIPAYVHHTYEALEDSLTIEVFGPGRPF